MHAHCYFKPQHRLYTGGPGRYDRYRRATKLEWSCRPDNVAALQSSNVSVDQMGELGGRVHTGLPILDIFLPETYRVGYFKTKNRTLPVLLWDWPSVRTTGTPVPTLGEF